MFKEAHDNTHLCQFMFVWFFCFFNVTCEKHSAQLQWIDSRRQIKLSLFLVVCCICIICNLQAKGGMDEKVM